MEPLKKPGIAWENVIFAVLTVFVGAWMVASVTALQGGIWVIEQSIIATLNRPLPSGAPPFIGFVAILLAALPPAFVGMLASRFAPDTVGIRAATRAWTLAAVFGGLLGWVRSVPMEHNELYLLLLALAAAGLALWQRGWRWLRAWLRARREGPAYTAEPDLADAQSGRAEPSPDGSPAAADDVAPVRVGPSRLAGVLAGMIVLVPWLILGSLGGLTETLLAAAAAAAVGWLITGVLDERFFAGFAASRGRAVGLGGLAAGVALVPYAAGIGGSGVQLAQMLVLPPLGFAVAALVARAWPTLTAGGTGWLIGVGAFGPLAFVDPEEMSILLGMRDIGYWTLIAALAGIAVAGLVGTAYPLIFVPGRAWRRGTAWATAGVVAVAAAGVYAGLGQPGLHGERLFVVLKEQADLSGLAQVTDRAARVRQTYERLTGTAERSQASLRAALDDWNLDYTPYYLVNGISVEGGPLVRQWLSGRDDVDRVLLEQDLRPLPEPAPAERGTAAAPTAPLWTITMIGADKVWQDLGVTGAGITVGSSDSGVDGTHPALAANFRGGNDSWYDPWNRTSAPTDNGGHGTHTTGTAVGGDGIGVAPGANWVGCVNLDRNMGNPAHYLDCLQFMLAPFPQGGDAWRDGRPDRAPQVLTNSWGCPWLEGCDARSLGPALAAFRAAGIYFVAAAGNSGYGGCRTVTDPPAIYADALTVGAVDKRGALADFSSLGPTADGLIKPDVLAPGVDVLSAYPGGTWAINSGTSMATPHVAGVVALMWSAQPKLIGDIDATTKILRDTATAPTPTKVPTNCGSDVDLYGSGIVNALAAVTAAKALG
ncbi:hypothetical protein GCM10009681_27450 [Luedemannella helvata]|uniref:Peptidase S8/S53 domain-containing protein n=1 Tax=Luedemannella helvata TaxID=349315 RepID=A0ABN2KFD0_9ACTN